MGFSLGGLIGGAMKGVGEGYSAVAKGELENQQKLEYQKEILRLTEEKDRRVEEWKAKELPKMRAEGDLAAAPTAAQARIAGLTAEARGALDSGLPALQAQVDATRKAAGITSQIDANIPALQADLDKRTYDAGRPLAKTKASDAGEDQATQTKSRVDTPGYTAAVSKEDVAKSAGELAVQDARNRGFIDRDAAKPPRGGGNSGSDTSIDLERRFKAAERNLAQQLGVAPNKVNDELAYLQRKANQGDQKAKDRWASVQPALADWQTANTALRNFTRRPGSDGAPPPAGAASGPGGRPPLSSFGG